MSNPSDKTRLLNSHYSNYDVPTEYRFDGDEPIGTRTATETSSLSDDDEASQLEEGTRNSEISTSSEVLNIGIANSPFLVATKNQEIKSHYDGFNGGRYIVKDGFSKLQELKLFGTYKPTDNAEFICIPNPARQNDKYAPANIKRKADGYATLHPHWHGANERYNLFMENPKRTKRELQRITAQRNKILSVIAGLTGGVGILGVLGISIGLTILINMAKNAGTMDQWLDIVGHEGDSRKEAKIVFPKIARVLYLSAILLPIGGFALYLVISAITAALVKLSFLTLNLQSRASFNGPVTNINLGPTDTIALPEGVKANETPNYIEYQGKYYILKDKPVGIIKTAKQIAEKGQEAPEDEIPPPEVAPPAFTGSKPKNMQGVGHFATSKTHNVYELNLAQQKQLIELQGRLPSMEQSKTFTATYNNETVYLKQENNTYNDNNSGMAILQVSNKNDFAQILIQAKNKAAIHDIIALAVKDAVGSKKIYHDSFTELPENMNKLYKLIVEHAHYEKQMNDYVGIFRTFYSETYGDRIPSFAEMLASINNNPANIDGLPHFGQLLELQRKQQDTATKIETLANSQEVYDEFMQFLSTGGQITPTLIKAYCMATKQHCRIWTVNANQLQYDHKNSHLPLGEGEIMDIIYDPNNSDLGHFYKAESISEEEYHRLNPQASTSSDANQKTEKRSPQRLVSSNASSLFGKQDNKNQASTPQTKEEYNIDEYSNSSSHSL